MRKDEKDQKATHHFDLVSWWIDQKPVEVFALAGGGGSAVDSFPRPDRRPGIAE